MYPGTCTRIILTLVSLIFCEIGHSRNQVHDLLYILDSSQNFIVVQFILAHRFLAHSCFSNTEEYTNMKVYSTFRSIKQLMNKQNKQDVSTRSTADEGLWVEKSCLFCLLISCFMLQKLSKPSY